MLTGIIPITRVLDRDLHNTPVTVVYLKKLSDQTAFIVMRFFVCSSTELQIHS